MSAEITKTVCDTLHLERILSLLPVVLLKIGSHSFLILVANPLTRLKPRGEAIGPEGIVWSWHAVGH